MNGGVLWRTIPVAQYMPDSSTTFLWNALAHVICTSVSLAPCFWPFSCQIPMSHNIHEFVSGAGRLPGQCACHILLVAVRIWRTMMFYQVLPSAVCHRQTGHIQLGDRSTFGAHRLPESAALRADYLRHCFHGLLFSLFFAWSSAPVHFLSSRSVVCVTDLEPCSRGLGVCYGCS